MPKKFKNVKKFKTISKFTGSRKSSRWYMGTFTSPPNHEYQGGEEERNKFIDWIFETSKMTIFAIVGEEVHESGKIHYHTLAYLKSPVKKNVMFPKYKQFSKLMSGSTKDKYVAAGGSPLNMVGYTVKDGLWSYKSKDPLKQKSYFERLAREYQDTKSSDQIVIDAGFEPKDEVREQNRMLRYVQNFMNRHGFKVNAFTLQIVKDNEFVPMREFVRALEKPGELRSTWGNAGFDTVQKWIKNPGHECLPTWEPDIKYVKFADCMYDTERGIPLSLDREDVKKIQPVRTYDVCILNKRGRINKKIVPTKFLYIINKQGWNEEEFLSEYAKLFRKKKRREKVLLICGKPLTGKSTLLAPYLDVYKTIIQPWTKDNRFSYAPLAGKFKVYAEELDVLDTTKDCNIMKQILEGGNCSVCVKNVTGGVKLTPFTFIATYNCNKPIVDTTNLHQWALMDRLAIYHANNRFDRGEEDIDAIDEMEKESWKVLVYVTSEPKVLSRVVNGKRIYKRRVTVNDKPEPL